jgi:hypothetical protein
MHKKEKEKIKTKEPIGVGNFRTVRKNEFAARI